MGDSLQNCQQLLAGTEAGEPYTKKAGSGTGPLLKVWSLWIVSSTSQSETFFIPWTLWNIYVSFKTSNIKHFLFSFFFFFFLNQTMARHSVQYQDISPALKGTPKKCSSLSTKLWSRQLRQRKLRQLPLASPLGHAIPHSEFCHQQGIWMAGGISDPPRREENRSFHKYQEQRISRISVQSIAIIRYCGEAEEKEVSSRGELL